MPIGVIFDMDRTLLSLSMDWPQIRSRLAKMAARDRFQPVFETMREVILQRPELSAELFGTLDEYELDADTEIWEGGAGLAGNAFGITGP